MACDMAELNWAEVDKFESLVLEVITVEKASRPYRVARRTAVEFSREPWLPKVDVDSKRKALSYRAYRCITPTSSVSRNLAVDRNLLGFKLVRWKNIAWTLIAHCSGH